MTYAQLITDIGKWMNRTRGELDTIVAQQIIESQYELEKKFPLWFLTDEFFSTILAGSSSILLPNFTIRVIDASMEDSQGVRYPFHFTTLSELRENYPFSMALTPETGMPAMGAVVGHVVEFGPQADDTYTMRYRLWHHLDPLDLVVNTSNEWTTLYLATLRYHVLCALSAYIKDDPRISVWEQRLTECLSDLESEVMRMNTPNISTMTAESEDIY